MAKIKYKERILKAAREKQLIICKATPIRLSAGFSANFAGQKGEAQYIQSDKRKKPTAKILYPARLSFRFERGIKSLQTSKS